MKNYFHSLVVILILCPMLLNAQTDVTISKKDFKNDKNGFETAWKHVETGDGYFKDKGIWYGSAFDEYLKASLYNSANPELNYKAGVAALYSDNKEEAIRFFQKVLEEKSDLTPDVLFYTGRALQYAGKYSEAVEKLNGYLNAPGKKPEENVTAAKKFLEECGAALDIVKDTLRVKILNAGSGINSSADDYSEILSVDGKSMFFTSRREVTKSKIRDDSKFDENIFYSTLSGGKWGLPMGGWKNLSTKYCEAPVYLNSAGNELYIYVGYEDKGDIKVSRLKNGRWQKLHSVPFPVNSSGSETSMTFTPSEDEVWFITDKGKPNLGGKDIFVTRKFGEHKWSKPENAGSNFNTSYDEESVRFSKSGDTLFFSSRGHNSIGGFDIYYSVKDKAGTWGKAVNYGYPVNTPWDELFYSPATSDDSLFYFASNRAESMGGLDIFQGRLLPPEPVVAPLPPPPKPEPVVIRDTVVVIKEIVQAPPPPPQPVVVPEPPKETGLYLIGKIKDSETGDPVMSKIDVIDFSTDAVIATTASSDVDGSYRVKLPAKKTYMIDLRATGFLSDMKRINIAENYTGDSYTLDVALIKVKVGKKVVLNNILFETGKSILTNSSYTELDRLLNILLDNAAMKIEISGHTDKTGSEPLNFKLSEDRARSVVEYLVQKGVDRSRLEYKGFGSLQPIADNATADGRTKNRRVEFKILEF